MKKYLLGSIAVVLAIVFSAFSTSKTEKYDAAYFWYAINGANLGARLGDDFMGNPVQYTQGQAISNGLTSCNDSGNIPCIAGHTLSDKSGSALPADVSDNYVKRTNP